MIEKKGGGKKFISERKKDTSVLSAPYQQLQATEQQLRASNQHLLASERELQKANADMGKRIKELNCLYGLSKLAMKSELSLSAIFKGLIKIIPQGWQYPDITAVRITYKSEKYKTDNFRKTQWLQSVPIMVKNKAEGMVEIVYLKKKPDAAEGPFLKEERTLLAMITERIGEIVLRIQEHEQLDAAYQQLAASEQQEKAINQQLRASEQQEKAINRQLRASEQEIRALEKIWREANDSLEDIMVVIDNDYNIIKINIAGLKLVGKKEGDVIGKKCYEVFHGTTCFKKECPLKKSIRTGKEGKKEVYVKDLEKYFSIKCSPIFNEKGKITGFIDLMMDITERKLEEEKVLKSEEQYRLLAYNSTDVIWKLDLRMVFTYASPSIKNSFGFTVDEWVGTRLSQHCSGKEFFKMARSAVYAVKNYKEFRYLTFEAVMLRKNGTEIPVEITAKLLLSEKGFPIGFQGTTRDIIERKKSEEVLKESEVRYRTLFETAVEGILIADIETKKFKYANSAICKMLGYDAMELCGMSVLDIHPKKDLKKVLSEFEIQAEGEKSLAQNIPCLRKDGTIIYTDISVAAEVIDKRECSIGFFTDVTERKIEEEKLLKSEEKYRLLAYNSIDVVWKMDLRMVFTYVSPVVKNNFGFTVDEWVGTGLSQHCSGKEFFKMAREAVKAIKHFNKFKHMIFDTIILHKDGTEVPVEIIAKFLLNKSGFPIGFQGTTRDITERKKAEKILKESMTKLQLLYDSSSDAIMLLDEKGFFDCNDATLLLFGCVSKKEFCSRHPGDFSPPTQPDGTDSMEYANNNIARALKEGSDRFEHLHRRLDGTDFSAEVLLDKMVLGGKEVLQARVYDITERKRAEAELKKYRDHLEELVKERSGELLKTTEEVKKANKELKTVNKELESFSYTASHDLKEPLRAIGTFSKILLEDYHDKLDTEGKDYLGRISKASLRMSSLIDDLLSLSRISNIQNTYELVDFNKLVDETINQIKPLIKEKKAEIKIDKLLQVFCCRVKIKEVFYNLIVNAIKYNDKQKPLIEVGVKGKVFFVKDNGLGIKKEYFDDIFRMFRRLHAEYGEGTGVGLSIVKKVIEEEHGGKIWIESQKGKGSTFFFTIPTKTDI